LLSAIDNGLEVEIIEKLLKAGANPNKNNLNGFNALFLSISLNDENIVKLLLKSGTHLTGKVNSNSGGYNILHLCCYDGTVSLLQIIIDFIKQSDSNDTRLSNLLNERDTQGETPIFAAISQQNFPMIKMLLDTNLCDLKIHSKENQNVLHYVAEFGTRTVLTEMQKMIGNEEEFKNLAEKKR